MAKHKTNPRRRPATQADVLKAKEEAKAEAIAYAFAIFFSVLADKEHAETDDLIRVWHEVNELSDSVVKGYVNITDLLHTLKTERGIYLK